MKFSTVFEVCFDRARCNLRPCSRYVSYVLEHFRQFARYASTAIEVVLTVLEVCFDHSRGMFRPCSRCVPTVLDS